MSEQPQVSKAAVRRATQVFLNRPPYASSLATLFGVLAKRKWTACLFGGLVRDVWVLGTRMHPRDIDVVVDSDVRLEALEREFRQWTVRRTRFGGLNLNIDGVQFDVWPLSETAALQSEGLPVDFASLPRTTFLNAEAVAVVMDGCVPSQVFEHGFLESVGTRVLEINRAANPFPQLCVVKSVVCAVRLDFAIGPKLATVLTREVQQRSAHEFEDVQKQHYGYVRVVPDQMKRWIMESLSDAIAAPQHLNVPAHVRDEFLTIQPRGSQ